MGAAASPSHPPGLPLKPAAPPAAPSMLCLQPAPTLCHVWMLLRASQSAERVRTDTRGTEPALLSSWQPGWHLRMNPLWYPGLLSLLPDQEK